MRATKSSLRERRKTCLLPDGQKEEISQNEHKRGISGWNFNLEDMKAQASLVFNIFEFCINMI